MTPFHYKRENRERLQTLQKKVKAYLRGRWFWKSRYVVPIHDALKGHTGVNDGTYIAKKPIIKPSFTENLRNEKGYADYLAQRFNIEKPKAATLGQ